MTKHQKFMCADIITVALLLTAQAWGQVTIDAVGPSSAGANANAHTLTFNHTEGPGTNRLLVVGACVGRNPDTGGTVSATYNGVPMTAVGSNVHSNGGTAGFGNAFILTNPPVGSYNVVITESGFPGAGSIVGGSVSFNGVDQTTPLVSAHTTSATGNSTTPAVTVTSAGNNVALDLVCMGSALSATNRTNQWRNNYVTSNAAGNGQMDTAAGATAVSFSNTGTADGWLDIGIDIKAAPAFPRPPLLFQ